MRVRFVYMPMNLIFENLHSIWFQETKGDDDSEIPNPLASGYQQSVVNSSIDYSNIL